MSQTTRNGKSIEKESVLYVALELSSSSWKLAMTPGWGQRPRLRGVPAGELSTLWQELAQAQKRFGLDPAFRIVSCYEAGRDGFWIHRALEAHGVINHVVDSASIEVSRHARRAKTDRLDSEKLLALLMRFWQGERSAWRVVRVPSLEAEDRRHLHRELETLKRDRTRRSNRIGSLLALHGLKITVRRKGFASELASAQQWDGTGLPRGVRTRVEREYERWLRTSEEISELEAQRRVVVKSHQSEWAEKVRRLQQLRGIGRHSAWVFVHELFGWRQFNNRRQVGAAAGLVPMPFQSGRSSRDQGISKAGNARIRTLAVEIAWGWLRFQPDSRLSRWFRKRFGSGTSRSRRVGIVALARKLLVSLWRYLEDGLIPDGAQLKASAA